MIKVAITGGIGSGKSIVCKTIESIGYPVYYSDQRAKDLINTSSHIICSLKNLYGEDIYKDGSINKKRLASIIFNSKTELNKVNAIVHPEVETDFINWTKKQGKTITFKESAIIFESQLEHLFNYTIGITTDKETRIRRVMNRENCTRESVIVRIKNQLPQETIYKLSDFIIENSETKALLPQIINIINKIK